MMATYEIPLLPRAQRFTISLAGIFYQMLVTWNAAANCWMLAIFDSVETPILSGVPVITGADLLAQYRYLGFGGGLVVQSESDLDAVPIYENLGTTSHVYFMTDE